MVIVIGKKGLVQLGRERKKIVSYYKSVRACMPSVHTTHTAYLCMCVCVCFSVRQHKAITNKRNLKEKPLKNAAK